jgi:endonuclease YncB( thermonuclease family)
VATIRRAVGLAFLATTALAYSTADGGGVPGEIVGPVPAELLRVIDGDTIEVRARIWLDLDLTTRVRLAGIDTPELNGGCAEERRLAEMAKSALGEALGLGPIWLTDIRRDKYGGRVVAEVLLSAVRRAFATMLASGAAAEWGSVPNWCSQ